MAHAEFNVVSGDPCENTPRRRDGAYVCNIHHLMGSGVKRTRFATGSTNPYEETLPDLAKEIRLRLKSEYKVFELTEVPLESFIGLSILRLCVRDEHSDAKKGNSAQVSPRAERVASLAFVQNADVLEPIRLHSVAQLRAISDAGIGSAQRVEGYPMAPVAPLLHLPITPVEREYAIDFAIQAFPAKGKASDPHVALHSIPGSDEFIEQLVTRDQLS